MSDLVENAYAEALAELFAESEEATRERLTHEAKHLLAILSSSRYLTDFLTRPDIENRRKLSVLCELSTIASRAMREFLYVTLENGRASSIEGILRTFLEIRKRQDGFISCDVITAQTLSQSQEEHIAEAVAKRRNVPRETILLNATTDKSIIGGAIAYIDEFFCVNYGVSAKIDELRRECLL